MAFIASFYGLVLKDYCSFLGLHATLDIWESLGGFEKVIDYCTKSNELKQSNKLKTEVE